MTATATDFHAMFENPDPWGLESLWYEARKRDVVLAALPEARYGTAFEAGCATGMLTERLAARCDHLLAVDLVPRAVGCARERMARYGHVKVATANLPTEWPDGTEGPFDLIVLSEIGYFFDPDAWRETAQRAAGALTEAGVILACHWLRPFAGRTQPTRQVHAAIARQPGLYRHVRHLEPDFLLEVWSRNARPLRQREPA
ncbi:SAM-dependent methyltransferase [Cupriavidus sp. 2KB_3]|uniref:class I SAM-dependent DNA methyltransferase n=1 Tax=Cupriavidus TaxID=106589 RepID=UPI0011EF4AD9|nr:SAM-dependent methyltransferase [Cupriavidus campinensis]